MFAFSVSYTTRNIRPNEVDGVHYNFVTKEKFIAMEKNEEFIETASVHGNFYGTAKAGITLIQDQKKIPLLDINVQGAIKFERKFTHSNFVFVCPPSILEMSERLVKRGTESEESLKTRVGNATNEITTLL